MMRTSLISSFLAAALLAAAPAHAGKLLVLDVSPPRVDLTKGAVIDGDTAVTVPAGGRLVLMNEAGDAVTIKGPYTGIPGGTSRAGGPGFLARLAAAIAPVSSGGIVLGASRGLHSTPPDPWAIDLTASGGHRCVIAGSAIVLWRSNARDDIVLALSRSETGQRARMTWAAGEATLAWPAAIPVADGATYVAEFVGTGASHSFTLHLAPAGELAALDFLAAAGCTSQLTALLRAAGERRVVDGTTAGSGIFK